MNQPKPTINIGRVTSGGIFGGLFGNPLHEKEVSEQYRVYFRSVMATHPAETGFLREKIAEGYLLYCPGCGIGSPTCHARIIEEELSK